MGLQPWLIYVLGFSAHYAIFQMKKDFMILIFLTTMQMIYCPVTNISIFLQCTPDDKESCSRTP